MNSEHEKGKLLVNQNKGSEIFSTSAEGILRAAEVLHAEAIIMGLNCRAHVDMISHLPRSTAYEVVCRARCPVLTVRS